MIHTRKSNVMLWSSAVVALTVALTSCSGASSSGTATESGASAAKSDEIHEMLPEAIKQSGVVKVGGSFAYPPMLTVDPADATKPAGIAPSLTDALGEVMGVKFTWQNTEWPGQLPGVQSGSLDAIMGQVSATAEREKTIADMVPFFKQSNGVVVPAGNPKNVSDLPSLCGSKTAVATGSLYVTLLQEASSQYCTGDKKITVAQYDAGQESISAVLAGQVDGYWGGIAEVEGFAKATSGLAAVPIPYEQTEKWDPGLFAIAVAKKNAGLAEAVAAALRELSQSGKYQEILTEAGSERAVVAEDRLVVNPLTGTPAGTTGK